MRNIVETESWIIRKIMTKDEAIRYGREQWCTSKPSQQHYENFYSSAHGDLYVLFSKQKTRPQYQCFISNQGYFELRDGGNLYVDIGVFLEENAELRDWFGENIIPKYTREVSRTCEQSVRLTLDLLELDRSPVRGQNGVSGINFISHSISHVHTVDELPGDPPLGCSVYIADQQQLFIYSGSEWLPVRTYTGI